MKKELKKPFNLTLYPSLVSKVKRKFEKLNKQRFNLSKYVNGILEQYGKL